MKSTARDSLVVGFICVQWLMCSAFIIRVVVGMSVNFETVAELAHPDVLFVTRHMVVTCKTEARFVVRWLNDFLVKSKLVEKSEKRKLSVEI
jgi:hypothetical protein